MSESPAPLPFPDSLCHGCAERRYVQAARSAFILCPVVAEKYPRQPVRTCPFFRSRIASPPPDGSGPVA